MIERLNLYDLYGYLFPGLTILGLLWLPFGVVLRTWPPLEFGSALLALVAGYVVGHVLHELSRWFFPSHSMKNGVRSFPSDDVLDEDDKTFSAEVKERIRARILEWYNIDVKVWENRRAGFAMCRNELLQRGRISYAEQFQGMYALMRGLGAGCFLSSANVFGWAIGSALSRDLALSYALGVTLVATLGFAFVCLKVEWSSETEKARSRWPGSRYAGLLVVLWGVGIIAALRNQGKMAEPMWGPFLMLSVILAGVGIICVGTYKSFSLNFARAVYNDFLVLAGKTA